MSAKNSRLSTINYQLPTSSPLRIVLVDGDEAAHQFVREAFEAYAPDWQLQSYLDSYSALDRIPRLSPVPAAVLMEVSMPGISGADCTRQIKAELPKVPVVMFTTFSDEESIVESFMAGACGYVIRPVPHNQVVRVVKAARDGRTILCPGAQSALVGALRASGANGALANLSRRETQVLALLGKGFTYGEIALRLGIETTTVNEHIKHLYCKLGVHTRREAVGRALGPHQGC